MSTNLENRERKDREKEKVRRQASEAQREKELERDRKNKGDIFCWRNNMRFCSSCEKMRNASGQLGENERQWKKKTNKNTYDISSLKHVPRKPPEVSRCSAKQRQRNVQRKCAARAKLLFAN